MGIVGSKQASGKQFALNYSTHAYQAFGPRCHYVSALSTHLRRRDARFARRLFALLHLPQLLCARRLQGSNLGGERVRRRHHSRLLAALALLHLAAGWSAA
jgi:hypothetical protein